MYYHKATLEQLQRVNREEFSNYYLTHKRCDTVKHFNITNKVFDLLVKEFDLPKLGHGWSTKFWHTEKFEQAKTEFLANTDIEEFIAYYTTHSDTDVSSLYGIAKGTDLWNWIVDELDLVKKSKGDNIKLWNGEHFDHDAYKAKCREIWDNRTDAEKQEIYDKRHTTEDELYGTHDMFHCEKSMQTRLEEHGDPYWSNREKARATCKELYGKEYYSQTDSFKDLFKDEEFLAKFNSKIVATKRQNGSFNTTEEEFELYSELCSIYGEDDVIHIYDEDPRYPFECDFYIPSEDLFIEYNGFWTHGPHPFDETFSDDIELLNVWKAKAESSDFFKNAIDTWTRRDVVKRLVAKKNNLNYIEIF